MEPNVATVRENGRENRANIVWVSAFALCLSHEVARKTKVIVYLDEQLGKSDATHVL